MKKEFRVKKSNDIKKIVFKRNTVGNRYFVIYKNKNHENVHFRYAVSVNKKFGNAVARNKIKRQIRSIIQTISLRIVNDYELVIVIKGNAAQLSYNELENQINYLMRKANLMKEE